MMRFKERIVHRLADAHVAGATVRDALAVCRDIAERGWGATLGPWGSPTGGVLSAAVMYESALQAIIDEQLDCVLSMKAPALGKEHAFLRELLMIAKGGNVPIRLDAQDYSSADLTFRLLERAAGYYHNVGCTLPARWRRSVSDLERVIEWGIPVRVVKGQWIDPSNPALDARESFRNLIDHVAGRGVYVSVATHDRLLANESLMKLTRAGSSCELEQLFGLPAKSERVARKLGVPLRMYVPYGHPYLPYNLSFVGSRPEMLGWMLRDLFKGAAKKIAYA